MKHIPKSLLCVFVATTIAPAVRGANKTFDGGSLGTARTWSTAANWAGDTLPATGDDLLIGGTALTGNGTLGNGSYLALTSSTSAAYAPTIRSVTFDNSLSQFPSGTLNLKNSSAASNSLSDTITFNTAGIDAIVVKGGTSPQVVLDSRTSTSTLGLILSYTGQANFSVLNDGTLTFTGNNTGIISGTGGINKTGNGTLVLGGSVNSFTGGLTISNGVVSTSAAGYLGSSAALNGDAVVINGGKLLFTGTGNATASVSNRGFKVGSSVGTIEISDSSRVWEIGGQVQDVTGQAGKLVKTGAGELILSNSSNPFTGGLVINQGVLTVVSTAGLGSSATNDSAVTINGGTLRYTNTSNSTSDSTRGFRVGASGGTIELVDSAKILTIAGEIKNVTSETGTLTKAGAGKLILSATNTYSGMTTVNAGSLMVNGSISASSLTTVNSGGTLGGSGTVGAVAVYGTGIVAPGNSSGIMTVNGNYSQTAGTLSMELNGTVAGTDYDQLNVSGSVTLGGALSAAVGYTPVNDQLLFILLNDGNDAINGTFSGVANLSKLTLGSSEWMISYSADYATNAFTGGNDIALKAIPEMSSLISGSMAALALLTRRTRNRQ